MSGNTTTPAPKKYRVKANARYSVNLVKPDYAYTVAENGVYVKYEWDMFVEKPDYVILVHDGAYESMAIQKQDTEEIVPPKSKLQILNGNSAVFTTAYFTYEEDAIEYYRNVELLIAKTRGITQTSIPLLLKQYKVV